jgi:hypothetical protein
VVIDEQVVGEVRNGRSASFEVEPGQRMVYLAIDEHRSDIFDLTLESGDHAKINCRARFPLLALLHTFARKQEYIKATLDPASREFLPRWEEPYELKPEGEPGGPDGLR